MKTRARPAADAANNDNRMMLREILSLTRKMGQHQATNLNFAEEPTLNQLSASSASDFLSEQSNIVDKKKVLLEKSQAFLLNGLQARLTETQDEYLRIESRLDSEHQQRLKLEQKISEQNQKLAEARQGLRDTQHALQNVQQTLEQAFTKRDQKELQLQKALSENKKLSEINVDLEQKLTDSESNSKSLISSRDVILNQMKEQSLNLQDTVHKLQGELVRIRGENTLLVAETEALRKKVSGLEQRFRKQEDELRAEYRLECDRLSDRLRITTEKLEVSKGTDVILTELHNEIKEKASIIRTLESRNIDLDLARREVEQRCLQSESQTRNLETCCQQYQAELKQCKDDLTKSLGDVQALRNDLSHSESLLKELAHQQQAMNADNELLKETIYANEKKILHVSEQHEQMKRWKREAERASEELDVAVRRLGEQDRAIRITNEERLLSESQYNSLQSRLTASISGEQEARQLLAEANHRIAELFNTVSDLSSKLVQSQQKHELAISRVEAAVTHSSATEELERSRAHIPNVNTANFGSPRGRSIVAPTGPIPSQRGRSYAPPRGQPLPRGPVPMPRGSPRPAVAGRVNSYQMPSVPQSFSSKDEAYQSSPVRTSSWTSHDNIIPVSHPQNSFVYGYQPSVVSVPSTADVGASENRPQSDSLVSMDRSVPSATAPVLEQGVQFPALENASPRNPKTNLRSHSTLDATTVVSTSDQKPDLNQSTKEGEDDPALRDVTTTSQQQDDNNRPVVEAAVHSSKRVVAADVVQLRALFGKGEEGSDDFGLGLVEGDKYGNQQKLERFLKHSDKILEDMKAKRAKYSEELDKFSEKFVATNGKPPTEDELPKDLAVKSSKVSYQWVDPIS